MRVCLGLADNCVTPDCPKSDLCRYRLPWVRLFTWSRDHLSLCFRHVLDLLFGVEMPEFTELKQFVLFQEVIQLGELSIVDIHRLPESVLDIKTLYFAENHAMSTPRSYSYWGGSRDGAVVGVLASDQSVQGSGFDWFSWSREVPNKILDFASFDPKLWSTESQITKVHLKFVVCVVFCSLMGFWIR